MENTKLVPLKQFFCDTCGHVIESINEGYVIWETNDDGLAKNFRIVHHKPHSPLKDRDKNGCYTSYEQSESLDTFFNENADIEILNLLHLNQIIYPDHKDGIENLAEFADFLRRIKLPYYEEARLYLDAAKTQGYIGGSNELRIFTKEFLYGVIENFGH